MSKLTDWVMTVRGTAPLWRALLYALDAAVIVLATLLAYYARFEGDISPEFASGMPAAVLVACIVYLLLLTVFGLYRVVLRYVGVDVALRLGAAVIIGFAILLAIDLLVPGADEYTRVVPIGVLFIQALLVLLGTAGIRMAVRVALLVRGRQGGGRRRVMIIGAGRSGSLLLREIQNRPDLGLNVVGFLDDDARLANRTIGGVPVIGTTQDLAAIAESRRVEEVVVAIPGAPQEQVRQILNKAAAARLRTRIMPSIVETKGTVSVADLRRVEVEDLLGRDQTPIDVEQVAESISGRRVLITGAAGSIGSELARQVLRLEPVSLVLLDVDETRLYELWLELETTESASGIAIMSICDIRDPGKLEAVFSEHRPEILLHAAAYKHVPLMELEPDEAVKTNVLGTRNVIEACEQHDCLRFVLISTDKAVAPSNVMGATKAVAERIMLDASRRGLSAVAVRFGNVLASRGSVVPIFEEQLRHRGPITVTDPDVTRFFMTIPEAARLVLQAQALGSSGDIFVLEMGEPVRIVDLAHKMIALSGVPADVVYTGLRPGEKLHESLLHEHEGLEPTGAEKIQRVTSVATVDDSFEPRLQELIDAATSGDPTLPEQAFRILGL